MEPRLPQDPLPVPPSPGVPERKSALAFAAVLFALVLPDLLAQLVSPRLGLAWSELFAILLPALCATSGSNLLALPWLGLVRPRMASLLLGALLGAAGFVAAEGMMSLWVLSIPHRILEWFPDVARIFQGPPLERSLVAAEAALLAPLCEEITFRGYLLRVLGLRWRPAAAIGLAALLFAARHLDPVRFPALLALGALFGFIAWRSGSVWPAVAAHAANNLLATALAMAAPPSAAAPALPGAGEALAPLLVGGGGVALLMLALRQFAPAPPPWTAPPPRKDPADPSVRFRPWLVPRWMALAALAGLALLCGMAAASAM